MQPFLAEKLEKADLVNLMHILETFKATTI
jgi:hypothetical protein